MPADFTNSIASLYGEVEMSEKSSVVVDVWTGVGSGAGCGAGVGEGVTEPMHITIELYFTLLFSQPS